MNQISKDDIAQSDLDQDATTREHPKFEIICYRMFSPISCLFQDRFSLEFRLLRTPDKPMNEGAVCIVVLYQWVRELEAHFKS